MSPYSVFKDDPPDKEPVFKPAILANTVVLKRRISLISNSKNLEEAGKEAINVLRSQQTLHKNRLVFKEEFEELNVLELELLEFRRFYKACLNESEIRLYETKFLNITVWMVTLAIYILYMNPSTEKLVKSERIMQLLFLVSLFMLLCRLVTMCTTFSYNLVHDGTPKISSLMSFEKIKKKKNEETTKIMLEEQLRMMDLFSKEVLPLRIKAEKVEYSQMYMKLASLIPIYTFYYICYNCFSARYDGNPSSESSKMFITVLYSVILFPFIWFFAHADDQTPYPIDRNLNICQDTKGGQCIDYTAHYIFAVCVFIQMTSPDIFTDRRGDKEPVIKPMKYTSTQIVYNLIDSIFDSKDIKIASDRAKRVLKNVRTLNKKTSYSEVEFTELKRLEMEFMDLRRFHKMHVNEMEIFLYSAKILTCFIWMVAFLTFVYYYTSEKPVESKEIMTSIKILLVSEFIRSLFAATPLFRYNLVHDGPPKTDSTLDFNKMKKEKTAEELTEEILREQVKIIDLYSEEVLPLKRKYYRLSNFQAGYKILGYLTMLIYIFICGYCFWNRSQGISSSDIHFFFETITLTVLFFPLWLFASAVSCDALLYG